MQFSSIDEIPVDHVMTFPYTQESWWVLLTCNLPSVAQCGWRSRATNCQTCDEYMYVGVVYTGQHVTVCWSIIIGCHLYENSIGEKVFLILARTMTTAACACAARVVDFGSCRVCQVSVSRDRWTQSVRRYSSWAASHTLYLSRWQECL